MEGVRFQTEGASSAAQAPSLAAKGQKLAPGEFFPGEHKFDDQIMKKADQAAAIMKEVEKEGDPTKKTTKTSLAKVKTESKEERAARYFALHGMKKIGHVLGEELSADAEAKASEEHDSAVKKIGADVAVPES